MGLIDWQRNLRLLDLVTRFFNTSGATYGGVPQHLRPSGRSLPLWRKTVANPKSEIFKLSEKEIYKKIHFWVNKIIQLTTHTGFSIRASGWQNLPSISLTLYFWKLPQQLESRSARHDSREGGNLLLSGAIFMCCHWIKKPNSLMMSVFCSDTLIFVPECCKSILRGPDFTIFPETWAFGACKLHLCHEFFPSPPTPKLLPPT